jgi:DNA-binding transcriptional regulator YiaG
METLPDKILWDGFGFPVVIQGARWKITPSGYRVLDIDVQKLAALVRNALLLHNAPLTGRQVKFFRSHLELTQGEFGKLVGKTHAAVAQWEGKKQQPTGMDFNTEMMLRLKIASQFGQDILQHVLIDVVMIGYESAASTSTPIEVVNPVEAA